MHMGHWASVVAAVVICACRPDMRAEASLELPRASIHLRNCDPPVIKFVLNNTTATTQPFRIVDTRMRCNLVD
jgi:hypothetical protein